jgi:hypothetical protein
MKTKMIEYFQMEVTMLNNLMERKPEWLDKNEAIHNAVQRCLGVAQFVDSTHEIPFAEIEACFNFYKAKLEEWYFRG